jgi:SAM-dependent MidA family methyltransferase
MSIGGEEGNLHHEAEVAQPISKDRINTFARVDRSNGTAQLIENAIQTAGGRIPYSRLMELSMFGPEGYYSKAKVKIAGEASKSHEVDFITHPEQSEHFGMTVGNTAMQVWESMDRPDNFPIVEMGAGNGVLAKDILVWARTHQPEFYKSLNYVIVEYGDLVQKQRVTVQSGVRGRAIDESTEDLGKVSWVNGSAYELPLNNIEGFIVSNELPDAFPVEVVSAINGAIKQKYVTIENDRGNDRWVEVWEDPSAEVQAYIDKYNITVGDGQEEPINLNAVKWQSAVDRALKRGAILTIDYGQSGNFGDKYKGHRAARTYPSRGDVYQEYRNMGNVDITSNVNFQIIQDLSVQDGFDVVFTGTEKNYLESYGLTEFARTAAEEGRSTKSFKRLVETGRALAGTRAIIQPNGFQTLLTTKHVSMETPTAQPLQENDFRLGVRLDIGERNGRDLIISRRDRTGYTEKEVRTKQDAEGYIDLEGVGFNVKDLVDRRLLISAIQPPAQFGGKVIPRRMFDSTDRDALKLAVERSGYTYDL